MSDPWRTIEMVERDGTGCAVVKGRVFMRWSSVDEDSKRVPAEDGLVDEVSVRSDSGPIQSELFHDG